MSSHSTDYLLLKRSQDREDTYYNWSKANINSDTSNIRAHACYILSFLYEVGWIVKQDKLKAEEYLKQSADLNHSGACYRLAQNYMDDNLDLAYEYVMKGINSEDFSIDVNEFIKHDQTSFKNQLNTLKQVLEYKKQKYSM